DILKMGYNVYLTGAAGSGKTYLLNRYIQFLKDRGVGVGITASTGIAATHMGGRTIHSWSGIGIKESLAPADVRSLRKNSKLRKRIEKTSVLIIDEVSMLRARQLDMIDKICKEFRNNHLSFGGLQIILCGDFFQLPPVKKGGEEVSFVNKSKAWQEMGIRICYLDEQHRQGDGKFLQLLNNIRKNEVDEDDIAALMERMNNPLAKNIVLTKLYTHNADVDAINDFELKKIPQKAKKYEMYSMGKPFLIEALKKSCLAPENLVLKKGAVVMFVKNNFEKGYVNGTLGMIADFDEDSCPIVKTNSGKIILATPESWIVEENGNAEARISQIPLRLAWAITVHKSQGMSLDAAQIDLSKSFEYGMGYVALSRVRSLDGIKLLGINEVALRVNPEITEIDSEFMRMSEEAESELGQIEFLEINKKQKEFFKLIMPPEIDFEIGDKEYFKRAERIEREPTHQKTKKLIAQKMPLEKIAVERGLVKDTVIGHIEKLLKEGEKIDIDYLKPAQDDFEKIKIAFKSSEDGRLRSVYELLGEKYSYEILRLARVWLNAS
ncbi:AAA family ATPase, partial [Patescibacteria group bacterium]|nr:AAA family ATPase [Patescibacteria group bacterium]